MGNNRLLHVNWLIHILIHWSVFQKDNDRRGNYWRRAREALASCREVPQSCSQEGSRPWLLLLRLVTALHRTLTTFFHPAQATMNFAVPRSHAKWRWAASRLLSFELWHVGGKRLMKDNCIFNRDQVIVAEGGRVHWESWKKALLWKYKLKMCPNTPWYLYQVRDFFPPISNKNLSQKVCFMSRRKNTPNKTF